MNRAKKRILLIVSVVVVGAALLTLVLTSFTGALVYFHTPTEIGIKSAEFAGRKIRIGGVVQEGSLVKEPGTSHITFLVTDGKKRLKVAYDGMVPDLFREGQGVIVEGIWHPGKPFQADTILAKHSEDYVPVEMSDEGLARSKASMLESLR